MDPLLLGSPRARAALAGPGGQETHFSPPLLFAGIFLPSAPPASRVFGRHCCGGCSFPPPFPAEKGLRSMGQSCKSHCSTGSRGDSSGVARMVGTQGFAPLPWEPRQHPLMRFKPQQQLKHPVAQPCPAQECAGAWGHLARPPRAVMSSSTRNSSVQDYFPSPFGLLFQGTGLIHRKNMKF